VLAVWWRVKTGGWRAECGVGCTIRRIGPSGARSSPFLSHAFAGRSAPDHPRNHSACIPILHHPRTILPNPRQRYGIARQPKPSWSLACRPLGPSVLRDRLTPFLMSPLGLLPAATTLSCLRAPVSPKNPPPPVAVLSVSPVPPARSPYPCCSPLLTLLLLFCQRSSLSLPLWRSPLQHCAAMPGQ
jgi:hypothetical protein